MYMDITDYSQSMILLTQQDDLEHETKSSSVFKLFLTLKFGLVEPTAVKCKNLKPSDELH